LLEMHQHVRSCDFRPINICTAIGLEHSCKFATHEPLAMIAHITDCRSNHGIEILLAPELYDCIPNILAATRVMMTSNVQYHCLTIRLWEPTDLRNMERFLFCAYLEQKDDDTVLHFACLHLHNDKKLATQRILDLHVSVDNTRLRWAWRGETANFMDARRKLKYPFRSMTLDFMKSELKGNMTQDFKLTFRALLSETGNRVE